MKKKDEIITFKLDKDLFDIIKRIPNRSEFIRAAILSALENACPLCNGTGLLNPKQKEHWLDFSGSHPIKKCKDCNEFILTCAKSHEKTEKK